MLDRVQPACTCRRPRRAVRTSRHPLRVRAELDSRLACTAHGRSYIRLHHGCEPFFFYLILINQRRDLRSHLLLAARTHGSTRYGTCNSGAIAHHALRSASIVFAPPTMPRPDHLSISEHLRPPRPQRSAGLLLELHAVLQLCASCGGPPLPMPAAHAATTVEAARHHRLLHEPSRLRLCAHSGKLPHSRVELRNRCRGALIRSASHHTR